MNRFGLSDNLPLVRASARIPAPAVRKSRAATPLRLSMIRSAVARLRARAALRALREDDYRVAVAAYRASMRA